ncbi:MAG: ASCH domain-containing protein [Archaeoglobaceae archaeon]|nr:ASCH domain-containing protein [Archaeoglobaceae archaeon]HDD36077.1 ASCH domain-containing protein [Archaeoglobus veneficus]
MKSRINFDKEYVNMILNGKKRTTIRKGLKSYPVGKIVEFTADNKVFCKARILKAVVKRLKELNDKDAAIDGFKSKDDLVKALKKIYGNVKDDEFVTIIHFEVVD